MRWITMVLIILLGTASLTEAATITITTTPEQDAALITLRTKLNATRATPLTAVEFRDYLVSQWLDSLVSQAGEHAKTTLRDAWEKADAATRAKVKTDLGMQ